MSSNKDKAELLAKITTDEIERSSVIFDGIDYYFNDFDFNELRKLESQLSQGRAMGLASISTISDNGIKEWEKAIIDYCDERDSLLAKLGVHYRNLISKTENEIVINDKRRRVLTRDYEFYKIAIAGPTARDKKMLGILGELGDMKDMSELAATTALKGAEAGSKVIFDQTRGKVKDKIFYTRGDIIKLTLNTFANQNERARQFYALKHNRTVISKKQFLKKARVIINERHHLNKRIALYKKRMQPSEWLLLGTNTSSFNAYPYW